MTDILMWASIAMVLFVGLSAGGDARARSADSLQVAVHAASDQAVDGWTMLVPDALPAGSPNDTLWISPETVALTPAAWKRLTFRMENQRPVLTVVPGPNEQGALRTLLRDAPGAHLVVRLNGGVQYATPVLSIEGTTRSLKLMDLAPEEAAQLAREWQQAHQSAARP
ncbi:hypothetical protein CRI93_05980 [Longimonas halophila]|uniref:Uncharacterized protein n=1 Tax=Longimonas halophila TaxID=1469170 RepID=A0A2H3NN78_9BACT|nr:hypothetical protein [Longimonas halophila]PEN07989.1 hypothetical protein CRI93_05980 [Longimonas halophila]